METKVLRGINFPNLPDTYMVPFGGITESSENPGCYYFDVDGTQEWFNPPMIAGVEYRTTERYNGKVVYTKLIDCGQMPNKNVKYIECGVNAGSVHSVCGYSHMPSNNSVQQFPIHSVTDGGPVSVCWAEGTCIVIKCLYNESLNSATAIIKYTKD